MKSFERARQRNPGSGWARIALVTLVSVMTPAPVMAGWMSDLVCRFSLRPVAATEKEARDSVDRFTGIALELGQTLRKRTTPEELVTRYLAEFGDAIYLSHLLGKEGKRGAEVARQIREALKMHALPPEELEVAVEVIAARAILAGHPHGSRGSMLRHSPEKVREGYLEQLRRLEPVEKGSTESSPLLKSLIVDAQASRLSENDSELKEYLAAVESSPGFNRTYGLLVTLQKELRAAGFWSRSKKDIGSLMLTRRFEDAVASWISDGVEGAFSGALAALDRDLAFRYWLGEPVTELGEKMDHSDYFILLSAVVSRASSAPTHELIAGKEELERFGRLLDAYAGRQTSFTPFHTDQNSAVKRLVHILNRELRARGR